MHLSNPHYVSHCKRIGVVLTEQPGSRSWYSLLGFIQSRCLLVTNVSLKSLQCAIMCLLVTKVAVKLHKWIWGLVNSCHQMSPCLSTNGLLKQVATFKHRASNFQHESAFHTPRQFLIYWGHGTPCWDSSNMCLLVTKVSLKSLQCARMCLLVTKVFRKSFKMRGTWMLVTIVSPNNRYIHVATLRIVHIYMQHLRQTCWDAITIHNSLD